MAPVLGSLYNDVVAHMGIVPCGSLPQGRYVNLTPFRLNKEKMSVVDAWYWLKNLRLLV